MHFLLTSFFLVMMALSFLTSYVTIRFNIEGLSKDWLSLISAFYNIGGTIGSFHAARLIARLGFIRSYTGFTSFIGLCILLLGFLFEPFTWSAIRFFIGYALGAIFAIVEAWIILGSSEKQKGRNFAFYNLYLYLGYAIAPYLFCLFGNHYTTSYPLMVGAFLCFGAILMMATTQKDSPFVESKETKVIIKDTFTKASSAFVQCFGSGMMNVIVYVFFPQIMFHHPKVHFSYLISFTILGGALFQYPVGLLSDRYQKRVLLIITNITIAATIPLCVMLFNTLWLIPLLMILGGCLFAIYPLTITLTCERFEKKDAFNIIQTLLLIYSLGCIIGPFIVTQLFLNIFDATLGVFASIFMINITLLIYTIFKR